MEQFKNSEKIWYQTILYPSSSVSNSRTKRTSFQFVASMLMRTTTYTIKYYELMERHSQHQEYTTGEIQIIGQQLTLINMK